MQSVDFLLARRNVCQKQTDNSKYPRQRIQLRHRTMTMRNGPVQRRLSLAAPLLVIVIGLLVLALGIAQRTIWQPPADITAEVDVSSVSAGQNAPLAVIESKALNQRPGPVKVNVQGSGSLQVVQGRSDDVDAWVGQTPHLKVASASDNFSSLNASFVGGAGATANPAGSDLWTNEQRGSGSLDYEWNAPGSGDWSLLVASDGKASAAQKISLTVPNDTSTPWAVPLIVFGSVLILLGLLYLIFGRGKGKKDGGSGRRAASAAAVVLLAALALSQAPAQRAEADDSATPSAPGSSESSSASASASAEPDSLAASVVTDGQFTRILDSVVKTVANGDAAKDANLLPSRIADPALQLRTGNYKIRSVFADYQANEPIADKLLTRIVSTNRAWPRSLVAVTQGPANVVPQLLTLVQATPRDNYKLTATARLLPGQSLPEVNTNGAAIVAADKKGTGQKTPAEALAALGDRLTNPDGAAKDSFAASQGFKYLDEVAKFQADTVAGSPQATIVFKHDPQPKSIVAFETADGGTLVFGTFTFTQDGTPKGEGDKLSVGDNAAAFTSGKDTLKGYVLTFDEQAVFYIPKAGPSAPMTMLAAERGLTTAAFK